MSLMGSEPDLQRCRCEVRFDLSSNQMADIEASPRRRLLRIRSVSSSRKCCFARKNNADFGELAWTRIDLYRPRMLFDNDIVGDGEAKASALSSGFCREERIEHLLLYLGRNARAVITNPDVYAVAEVLRRGGEAGFIAFAVIPLLALGRRIEAVGDQVQESSCDLLREYIDLTGGRIKGPLQSDLEALILGARTMIGQIKALLDEGISI